MSVRSSWAAWRAATRSVFWSLVDAAARAIRAEDEAARRLTVLHPREPEDLYRNGFALFVYDINRDCFHGMWRAPGRPRDLVGEEFWWDDRRQDVPWHPVMFPDLGFGGRAVLLEYARASLKRRGLDFPIDFPLEEAS